MTVGFELQLHVHYGVVWLQPPEADGLELLEARGGQRNGIWGAACPGVLSMLTGLHTGIVPFRVELWDAEPPVGPGWEDVVDVDFLPFATELSLSTFQQFETILLPAVRPYRARYCAQGMDAASAQGSRSDGEPVTDRYLLALWPAARSGEVIVRQTSDHARYWASVAQETPRRGRAVRRPGRG